MNADVAWADRPSACWATALLLSVLCVGCASVQLAPIRAGEQISVVAAPGSETPASIEVSNQVIGKYAGNAAWGGAWIGAQAGLACGPFALICIPLGAAVVGAGGAIAGAVVGIAESPGADAAAQLRVRIAAFSGTHDPRADLVAAIAERSRDNWTVVPDSAAASLVVRLDAVGVHLLGDESAAVAIRVTVDVRRQGVATQGGSDTKVFEYAGEASPISQWIADHDDFVAENFRGVYRRVANLVYAELAR